MTMAKQLSQHDKDILARIRRIDDEYGYTEWPVISGLADKLEDEEEKAYWKRRCTHYNHLEEARIGEL